MGKYDDFSKEDLLKLVEKQEKEFKAITKQKYGLFWDKEKEPEKVVIDCETNLPILKRVKNKEIKTDDSDDNIFIEGDNYHSLTVLNYTHKEKIDVIYIDPPYNTGNKDFIYNDSFVDKDDGYRHSKWLNFMEKRLRLAKNLLKDTGVIFISIDDNEMCNIKLLCDKIFGEENKITILPTIMNLKGNNDEFGFSGTHEYTIVYAINKNICKINQFPVEEEDELSKWLEDDIGFYKKGANLKATGEDALREKRTKMFYPILYKDGSLSTITDGEYSLIYNSETKTFNDEYVENLKTKYEKEGFNFILPKIDNVFTRWRWGWNLDTKNKLKTDVIAVQTKTGISLYKKQRPELGDLPTKKPKSIFYKPEYSSGNGTALQKQMFGKKVFNNPKPLQLIKDLIFLGGDKKSTIIDFFAGSSTTAQAVLELNKEDGGKRKFIVCTNNESGIAETVSYPRISKVINGYITQDKNKEKIEGLNGNLQYFKTDLIPIEKIDNINDEKRIELTEKAGQMIALKENCFEEIELNEFYQIFSNKSKDKNIAIYFREDMEKFEELTEKIKDKDSILYIFSFGKVEKRIFKYLGKNINIEDIPQPILDIYREINQTYRKNK